jgi:hypothetical protein
VFLTLILITNRPGAQAEHKICNLDIPLGMPKLEITCIILTYSANTNVLISLSTIERMKQKHHQIAGYCLLEVMMHLSNH